MAPPLPPPSSYTYALHCPSPLLVVPSPPTPTSDEQSSRVTAAAPVSRYSAEERRERIDKYRSKRNQRNFQKKITYACRKTLADSRPRVKGRFARNAAGDYTDDADAAADHLAVQPPGTEVPTPASPDWWPAPAAHPHDLPAGITLADLCAAADDDEEMLAAYLGVSSITIDDHHHQYI